MHPARTPPRICLKQICSTAHRATAREWQLRGEQLKLEYLRKDIFAHNVDTRGPAQEQTAHVFGKLHECKLRDSIPVTYKRSLNCCNMKKKFSNIYWELVGEQ